MGFCKMRQYLWQRCLNMRGRMLVNGLDTLDGILFHMQKLYGFIYEDYCQYIMEEIGITDIAALDT